MYFDFDDYRPDIEPVGRAITARDGLMLSIAVHAVMIVFLLFGPSLTSADRTARDVARAVPRTSQIPAFVFTQPRVDIEAPKPPPVAENSDKNREARTRERPPDPKNALPFSRGNSPERTEAMRTPPPSPNSGQASQPSPPVRGDTPGSPPPPIVNLPGILAAPAPKAQDQNANGNGGAALGEALRNLQRYVQNEQFENPHGGGGQYGSAIQFDDKGVDFGPWLRRFVAQIKRNWFIPYAAMSMKGHVVITFYVHKDGTLTAISVIGPCSVDAFNNAAFNALAGSNPTEPLPPEYPTDRAFFTVTFFYNETPPSR